MKFEYRTRGNVQPQGKPKVYVTGHPEDCKLFLEEIADEILSLENCGVYFDGEPEAEYDREELTDRLGEMQLFVVPVTKRFLCEKNRAFDLEFPFAVSHHIPVLPLARESGLEQLFNEKCGDLQILDRNDPDVTAIPYQEKLKKFLGSVLVGDELAAKVRAAFDAYIFLSYRKKDRRYAQKLMELIHKNAFCRDIAIWYDEFLTPGENFNDAIANALQNSQLFALAVTPNLLEEHNYVMKIEYPKAAKAGKLVVPAELEPTDQKRLKELYEDIPDCVDAYDDHALSGALLEAVKSLAIRENDSSPEHNFFIGLAYLNGIDVEVNHERGVSLITGAAQAGLPEAMEKLVNMYRRGNGVERNYQAAIPWQERLAETLSSRYEENSTRDNGMALTKALEDLGQYYYEQQNYAGAKTIYQKTQSISQVLSQVGVPRKIEKVHIGDQTGKKAWEAIKESRRKLAGSLELKLPDSLFLALAYLELLTCWNLVMFQLELLLAALKIQLTAIRYIWNLAIFVCRQWKVQFELAKPHWTVLKTPMLLIKIQTGVLRAEWEEIKRMKPAMVQDFAGCGEGLKKRAATLMRLVTGRIFEAKEEVSAVKEMRSEQKKISAFNKEKIKGAFLVVKESLAEIISINKTAEKVTRAQVRNLMTYGQMGDVSMAEGHPQDAGEYYLRYLKGGEKLKKNVPREEISQLVMAVGYHNMGNFCLETGEASRAEEYYQKMIREVQSVRARFPEFTCGLVIAWNNLGDGALAEAQIARAEWYYLKGLAEARKMGKDSGGLKGLSLSFDRMGDLRKAQGKWEEALNYYEEALKTDQQLCEEAETTEKEAITETRALALSRGKLGDCYLEMGQEEEANRHYKEASRLCRQISQETGILVDWKESPRKQGEFQEKTREKLENMDMGFLTFGEAWEEAKQVYRTGMESEDENSTVPPEDVDKDLMFLYISLGKEFQKEKEPRRAREFFERAQTLGAKLCETPQTLEVRREFSYSCDLLGRCYERQGQTDLAEKYYLIQVETDRKLYGEETSLTAMENLAFSCERLRGLYREQGRLEEAKAFGLERAQVCAQVWEEKKSEAALRKLAESFESLAAVCGEAGQEEEKKIYQKKAFEGYSQLCEISEDSSDQVSLGVCYANAQGVERNWEQAIFWYRRAANQGNPYGQYNLGRRYFRGEGVEKSYEEAVAWFKKAAEQDCKEAQRDLAHCYREGLGVEQDTHEAARWQNRADE